MSPAARPNAHWPRHSVREPTHALYVGVEGSRRASGEARVARSERRPHRSTIPNRVRFQVEPRPLMLVESQPLESAESQPLEPAESRPLEPAQE